MKILMFAMKLNNQFKLCVKIFYGVDGNEMGGGGGCVSWSEKH